MTDAQVQALLQSTGPLALPTSLAQVEPQLNAAGIMLQRNSAGEIRGRLYWGNGRTVDVVQTNGWGLPWVWIERDPGVGVPPPGPTPPPGPDPEEPEPDPCDAVLTRIDALLLEAQGIRADMDAQCAELRLIRSEVGVIRQRLDQPFTVKVRW